ncbi:major facilitator superfamily domain-containing protein 9-like [Belonocnema kinseyi]|uniref:major facilitator superfamily domain-containing protein 9-like n=1 Tax=Belonocnema kinseyi TaxID=2817044 RepID=UPI00143D65E1|nr:major facilitator superfamily domain-containing protein 9-like [Belonocnema kinseyi]
MCKICIVYELSAKNLKMTFHVSWTYIICFLDFFGISVFIPLFSGHLKSLGASHFFIGAVSSIYAGCQLLSGPIIGSLSDRLGRQNILIFCLSVTSACYFFMGITYSFYFILFLRATLGTFKHIQSLNRTIVADHVSIEDQTVVFGRLNAIAGISFTIGPAIGGHFAELENGFSHICYFTSVIFVLNIVISYLYLEDPPKEKKASKLKNVDLSTLVKSIPKNLIAALYGLASINWPIFWDIFLMKFVTAMAKDSFINNYSIKVRERFQVSPKSVGYSLALQGFSAAVAGLSMGYINKLLYKEKVDYERHSTRIHIFVTFIYLALLCTSQVQFFVLFGMVLTFFSMILRVKETEMLFQRCPPSQRGSLVGMGTSITNIARMLAPLIVGIAEDLYGVSSGITLAIIMSIIAIFVSIKVNNSMAVMAKND